ncbi:hypothetical protein ATANTOWER_024950 [Ataeniobius toweri]|uniref:Ig-like domain-containing protein n=1 Tax=Ataeniobius toweri TaxID=208326 RepID=A0ABU7BIJ1_9TELE|nr:hypothetical protein [Ataeniobius toweri]
MICGILLLIILNSCLCAATFVVNVTQSCYQAEENHNITLEWTFTTKPDGPWRQLFIFCRLLDPHRELDLYQVHDGFEMTDFRDHQFSGRVQSDNYLLREGRIRLHVSRLRTEDSGLYRCKVMTDGGDDSARCQLSVSGESQVIGSHDPIIATVGQNVILPCHLEPPFNMGDLTVEWKFQDVLVHLYPNRVEYLDAKQQRYKGRTSLFYYEMTNSNISLKLTNVTKEDEGNYFCSVPNLCSQVRMGNITLHVDTIDENGGQGHIGGPGGKYL